MPTKLTEQEIKKKPLLQKRKQKSFGERALEFEFGLLLDKKKKPHFY